MKFFQVRAIKLSTSLAMVFFDPENANNSGLCFRESFLRESEIKKSFKQNPLIFINTCNSGIIKNGINGFAGLSATLISNGAINYIGSMWPIFDDLSYKISILFYKHILQGFSVGASFANCENGCY